MDKYSNYEIEDFVTDETFVNWIFNPDRENTAFWTDWLVRHPHRQAVVLRAQNVLLSLQLKEPHHSLTAQEVSAIAIRVREEITIHKGSSFLFSITRSIWFRSAAVLLVMLTFAWLFFKRESSSVKQEIMQADASVNYVNNGLQPKLIRLQDQSLVILQPHSSLRYPRVFTGNERGVELVGEAFFEVRKNPEKPFMVYTSSIVTRVLGTSFTVRAFPNTEAKVIVNTGKVQVTKKDKPDKVLLQLVLLSNEEVTVPEGIDTLQKSILKEPLMLSTPVAVKVFSFNEAPLSEIVEKLQQAYHVTISYDHEKYANATVTASLGRLPLDEKVRMICKAIDAQYAFEDGAISIK